MSCCTPYRDGGARAVTDIMCAVARYDISSKVEISEKYRIAETFLSSTIKNRLIAHTYFWSYCSEVGFIKVPCDNKFHIWVRGFLLTYIPIQFLECLVCVGLRGNVNTAVIMIAAVV